MNILLIVNNPVNYLKLRDYFESKDHQIEIVHNYRSAQCTPKLYNHIFYEKFTQGAGPEDILKWSKEKAKCIDDIGSIRSYLESLELPNPEPEDTPSQSIANKSRQKRMEDFREAKSKQEEAFSKNYYRGQSKPYQILYSQIKAFAPILDNFLLVGASGTGKEHTAYEIHKASGVEGKFVSVDCGVFNDELIASELFGHVKGSFTGAVNDKTGYFATADNGTLFLDEIENLSYKGQISLLRVLQERVFSKVGGTSYYPVTCKIICSTNVDLQALVEKKRFRLDLYHRINQVTLQVPSLSEVKEDLPELIQFLMDEISLEYNAKFYDAAHIKKQAIKELYPYPGNIRQLKQWLITKAFEHISISSDVHGIELMRMSIL